MFNAAHGQGAPRHLSTSRSLFRRTRTANSRIRRSESRPRHAAVPPFVERVWDDAARIPRSGAVSECPRSEGSCRVQVTTTRHQPRVLERTPLTFVSVTQVTCGLATCGGSSLQGPRPAPRWPPDSEFETDRWCRRSLRTIGVRHRRAIRHRQVRSNMPSRQRRHSCAIDSGRDPENGTDVAPERLINGRDAPLV
jgi:hypothetical protein